MCNLPLFLKEYHPLLMRLLVLFGILFFLPLFTLAQTSERLPLLESPDSLHKGRFWVSVGGGAAIYSGFSIALWEAWYKDFELGPFQFFDDSREWRYMDKVGHMFTAYNEANWVFEGARWTGMKRRSAMWTGVGVGSALQATIEVMDGFFAKVGFLALRYRISTRLEWRMFASQELAWQEQRIVMKVSSTRPCYSSDTPDLIGGWQSNEQSLKCVPTNSTGPILPNLFSRTITARRSGSLPIFIPSFLQKTIAAFPPWLNIAIGYGAENMYGGFSNNWPAEDPVFFLSPAEYPRYSQFFISPDIDLRRIPVKKRWMRTVLGVLNFIKIPAPALEFTTQGKVKAHAFYW
jgi:hypothetical protein